ncbi:MAG TPA: metal-sulfur cluster assembly factor [Symbiobacteriaceae bacterium]|nr:metal-sulfur cluster assembly factor [Symbiobacteriaceae bacterium]
MVTVDEKDCWEALKGVMDPELGINIVDLGLVYEIVIEGGEVCVVMTLTTPGCPLSGSLPKAALNAVAVVPGVMGADVVLTFDPPWSPQKISPAGRQVLAGN